MLMEVSIMNATRIETVLQSDGELHLTQLPFRKGDRVEAIILSLDKKGEEDAAKKREEARQRFLELAKSSSFRSTGPYPNRDELHAPLIPIPGFIAIK
jgi:hypothetical protein